MAKRPKNKTRAANGRTADELKLQEDKRRLQRQIRDRKTIAALARKLRTAIVFSELRLSELAKDIADDQGFQIVPYDKPSAVNE
jgi:hypothetical protein